METITVLKTGASVTLPDGGIGRVLSVAITGETIEYKVSWWNGGTHYSEWLRDFEVVPATDSPTRKIGYAL